MKKSQAVDAALSITNFGFLFLAYRFAFGEYGVTPMLSTHARKGVINFVVRQ